MLSAYLLIGQVLRPQGVKGLVKVRPDTDDPDRFLDLEKVFVKKGEDYVETPVDEISVRDNDTAAASGSFYIPWDIGTITIIAGTAAIMIWTVVLLRSLVLQKKGRKL